MSLLALGRRLYTPFLDPVFVKDLEGLSRRWRMYAGRMMYVALAGVTVYLFLGTLKGPIRVSESAALGRNLFSGLVTLQMGYVTIAMAHLAADLLLREARSGTLQLMLLTPLSGWRIALGKWKSVMAHASSLIVAGIPPLGITAYLGGVELKDLLWSSSLSLAMAGLSSAMAMYVALHARTAVRAAAIATALIVLWALILLVFAGIPLTLSGGVQWFAFAAACLHPIAAAVSAANPAVFGEPAAYAWIVAVVLCLGAAQVLLMSTAGHLSISSTLDELLAPRGTASSERKELPTEWAGPVWDRHPLLWREISLQGGRLQDGARRMLLITAVVLLGMFFTPTTRGSFEMDKLLLVLTGFAMAGGSGLFVLDREGRHLDVLLTLPVGSGAFVGAKLIARVCTLEGAAYVVCTLFLLEIGFGDPLGSRRTLTALVVCFIFFSYVVSALASLHARTSRGAFLLAASLVWGLLLGLPLLRQVVPEAVLGIVHPTILGEGLIRSPGSEAAAGFFILIYGSVSAVTIAAILQGYRRQLR